MGIRSPPKHHFILNMTSLEPKALCTTEAISDAALLQLETIVLKYQEQKPQQIKLTRTATNSCGVHHFESGL